MKSRKTTGSPSVTKYASPGARSVRREHQAFDHVATWVVSVRCPPPPIQANLPASTAATIAGSSVVSPAPDQARA